MKQPNQVLLHESMRVGADIEAWQSAGGGEGLNKALSKSPEVLIQQLKEACLRGLGGSGFPTYKKWEFLAAQQDATKKYLIVNGNEDEPGTFKDRILLSETLIRLSKEPVYVLWHVELPE